MGKNFFKTILFKEADKRLLCRFGSAMCNKRLPCDKCIQVLHSFKRFKFSKENGVEEI